MKFYGQFDPPVDRFLFERYFPDRGISGIFVECGAFDGLTECSCKFFEETLGWSGFNLEPVPALFAALQRNRPNSRNLQLALSDRGGLSLFRHVHHPNLGEHFGNGSITHAPDHLADLKARGCTVEEIEVLTITWRDFTDKEGIDQVDLLVLDVEGHEMQVLKGMKGGRVWPLVMCIEYGHIGLGRLRSEMSSLGYEYDISSNANAFFVRRDVLPLFALRRSRMPAEYSNDADEAICRLEHTLQHLKERERVLLSHIESIERSRGVRAIRWLNRVLGRA